jgi:cytochrome c553
MIRIPLLVEVQLALACLATIACQSAFAQVDFAHDVFPIFKSQCSKCHGGDEMEGGFSLNSRETLLKGADSGPAIVAGKSRTSLLYEVIATTDPDTRMPPEGEPLTEMQITKIAKWIDEGAVWEPGLTLAKDTYEPPLLPRRPDLPKATPGFEHPIDRLLQGAFKGAEQQTPFLKDDAQFARRLSLDLIGLLPEQEWLSSFLKEESSDKRTKLIRILLSDKRNYAEHWLTFWNDLLRNDYSGTGFITGGRKQISQWLYKSLIDNKPYDQMARDLISPTADSAGFSEGIRWRGTVSAGQTVEIQFSQSVGQSFLGINLKCASCHDSFIDRWKLDDAYGLAAVFSKTPLDVHRCDKPTGKQAKPAWLFPELGTIDPELAQPERLRQLAGLMTHPQNGRFSRTIVNRLWHRLMGRGIVEPVDSMQSRPWNEDLLDWLAVDFAEHGYDIKHTIELICSSNAYQSQVEVVLDSKNQADYVYRGPRGKRMTAEQFVDCVWQLCDAAPTDFDAPVVRGEMTSEQLYRTSDLRGKWIWSSANAERASAKDKASFQRSLNLTKVPPHAVVVATCDNSFELFINKKKVLSSDNWESISATSITKYLKAGSNEFLLSCKNGGESPNPAGVFLEARWIDEKGNESSFHTDADWQFSKQLPGKNGSFKGEVTW